MVNSRRHKFDIAAIFYYLIIDQWVNIDHSNSKCDTVQGALRGLAPVEGVV